MNLVLLMLILSKLSKLICFLNKDENGGTFLSPFRGGGPGLGPPPPEGFEGFSDHGSNGPMENAALYATDSETAFTSALRRKQLWSTSTRVSQSAPA